MLHVLRESSDGALSIIATLVVTTHLNRSSKEAFASLTADHSIVFPKRCVLARDLIADGTNCTCDSGRLLGCSLFEWWRVGGRGHLRSAVVP